MSWLSVVGVSFFGFQLLSAPLDNWHWRNPVTQGNNLNGIAYGNGRLVAVGEGGAVVVSTNGGVDWETHIRVQPDNFPIFMTTLAFGNGLFVASRSYEGDGTATSTDGVTWTRQPSAPSVDAMVFSGGKFFALGYSSVAISTDAVHWSFASVPLPMQYARFHGAASANGTSVIVGDLGAIAATTNGIDWVKVESGVTSDLTAAVFDGREFLVTGWHGAFLASSDGLHWTNRSFAQDIYFLAAASRNGRTALAGQVFGVAENGTRNAFGDFSGTLYVTSLTVDSNGVYWAAGEGGAIRRSPDGFNWTEVTSRVPGLDTFASLRGVTFDGQKFVAVGQSYVLWSSNGVNWTKTNAPFYLWMNDVAWGNGRFVAVGFDYSHPRTEPLASSPDGTNWTVHSVPLGSVDQLMRVKFLNGHFIAIGNEGVVALSTNGMDWRIQSLGSNLWLTAVAYGEGKYLVGSDVGTSQASLFSSRDAVTWTSNAVSIAEGFWDMIYGRGRFVAAYIRSGWPEGMMWSPDGREWTSVPGFAERVVYHNGIFIAAGASSISTSFDGRHFTLRNFIMNQVPNGITFGRGTYVVVGTDATIIQSDRIPPAFMLSVNQDDPGRGPLVSLDSPVDGSYEVQSSSDSTNWTTFATVQSTNGTFELRDVRPASAGPRFYRAVLPELIP